MRKIALIGVMAVMLSACGQEYAANGKSYETYGLFNKFEVRDAHMKYRLIVGNVFWGLVLMETVIAPIYFFGFSLYEPVGLVDQGAPQARG